MSLQSIRNINLFATISTGSIGIMSSEKDDTIFILELKECSKRIYEIPKVIFYALVYARACPCWDTLWHKKVLIEKEIITTAYIG